MVVMSRHRAERFTRLAPYGGSLRSVVTVSGGAAAGGAHDEVGDQRGPARLVGGADTTAGVAVEVLVEGQQVVPVRVGLEEADVAEDRAAAVLVVEIETRRWARSSARTVRVTLLPEPAGCSMRMSSPKNRAYLRNASMMR